MKLKSVAAAIAILAGTSAASAAITNLDLGSSWLTYDDSSVLGTAFSTSTGVGAISFSWTLSPEFGVAHFASTPGPATATAIFGLPKFTITAKSGYSLSGPVSATLAGLSYEEGVGSSTTAKASYDATSDGFLGTANRAFNLTKTIGSFSGGVERGTYGATDISPYFPFSTYTADNILLTLTATGRRAFVAADENNALAVTFQASVTPVPEPETYAMLLAGVGVVGWVARRRRQS